MTTSAVPSPVAPATSTARPAPAAAVPHWTLDASHSHVAFAVRHLMISNVRGEFTKVSGEANYDPAHPEASRLAVTIDLASINTRDEKRDGHLRSADFFDVEKYPSMTFVSKSVRKQGEGLEIIGALTIRDTTRDVTLTLEELTPEFTDPWGNRRVGASGRAKIRRSDFGMKWNAALEAGGVLVGDDITIQIEAELIRDK